MAFANLFSGSRETAGVHVRFGGRSFDVSYTKLDEVHERSSDAEIKRAVARWLDVSESKLIGYVVDRHRNGNLTLRPQAVFG